jgi:hypothetical protein
MATWIAHFRIAENLLEVITSLDPHQFAIGNIAPDSGIPDEKWEKFTPPTEITHFRAPDNSPYPLADLRFYHQYLVSFKWPASDVFQYSFLLGYFCHLVTDNLWHQLISLPTHQRFKTQFDGQPGFIWEVKKDWYGLDYEYVRSHPDTLYWKIFLQCQYTTNYLEILLPEGVSRNIQHIKEYYQRTDDHAEDLVSRERIYLTKPEMDGFVEIATLKLAKAWEHIQDVKIPVSDHFSVLEIL